MTYVTSTGEIIMYVRAGAILPRYRYAQSTAYIDRTHLEMDVYTGRDGTFTVYEDDGVTEQFRSGASSTTELTFTNAALRTVVRHPSGTYAGAPAARRYVVRLHGLASPVGMRVNGGPALPAFTGETAAVLNGAGQSWDANRKILTVVTPAINVSGGGGVAATVEPTGAPFPAASPRRVFDATDTTRAGAVLATQHRGYTGFGYADYQNATGDHVEWTVPVPAAGTYAVGLRYAGAGPGDRPLDLTINGTTAVRLALPPTGGWSTWRTTTVNVPLPAGASVHIRATATGAGGPNVDCLIVG